MKRYALQNLVAWKNSKNRKPLLLYGARQVGKTWLMEEFGKTNFSDYVAINVEKNERIANVFNNTLNLLFSVEGFLRKRFGSVWTRMRPEAVCGQARFGDNSVGKLRGIL